MGKVKVWFTSACV